MLPSLRLVLEKQSPGVFESEALGTPVRRHRSRHQSLKGNSAHQQAVDILTFVGRRLALGPRCEIHLVAELGRNP